MPLLKPYPEAPGAPAPPPPGPAAPPPLIPGGGTPQDQAVAGQQARPAGAVSAPQPPPAPAPPTPGGGLTAESIQQQVDTTIPVEQFQAYIDGGFLKAGCPPNTPFKQDKAHIDKWFGGKGYQEGACVEKPTDQAGAGGRGGGGGGAGGPGGFGGLGRPGSVRGVSGKAQELWDQINSLKSRYSPEVMQRIIGQAKARGSAGAGAARDRIASEFASRGLGRSADAAIASEAAARSAEAGVVNPVVGGLATEKVNADRQDRVQKLQAMQAWINSSRQYILGSTATRNQKEIALADLDLQSRRLDQELEMQQNRFDYGFAREAYSNVRY